MDKPTVNGISGLWEVVASTSFAPVTIAWTKKEADDLRKILSQTRAEPAAIERAIDNLGYRLPTFAFAVKYRPWEMMPHPANPGADKRRLTKAAQQLDKAAEALKDLGVWGSQAMDSAYHLKNIIMARAAAQAAVDRLNENYPTEVKVSQRWFKAEKVKIATLVVGELICMEGLPATSTKGSPAQQLFDFCCEVVDLPVGGDWHPYFKAATEAISEGPDSVRF